MCIRDRVEMALIEFRISMLQDHNLKVYTYNKETAQEILANICNRYLGYFQRLGGLFSNSQRLANERLIWTHPRDHLKFADDICWVYRGPRGKVLWITSQRYCQRKF